MDCAAVLLDHAQCIYRSVLSKLEFFIKMKTAYLLSPSFITRGRVGACKAALILMKSSHFDRTLRYKSNFNSAKQSYETPKRIYPQITTILKECCSEFTH